MTTIQLKSGATEIDIQSAINSLKDGGTVVFSQNDIISIKTGLVINAASRDVTLDLNGATLKQEANVGVIRGSGSNDASITQQPA